MNIHEKTLPTIHQKLQRPSPFTFPNVLPVMDTQDIILSFVQDVAFFAELPQPQRRHLCQALSDVGVYPQESWWVDSKGRISMGCHRIQVGLQQKSGRFDGM